MAGRPAVGRHRDAVRPGFFFVGGTGARQRSWGTRPWIGYLHRADEDSARSARLARRLAVDSERAVAWVWSPKPIDILVRISLWERTGLRPIALKKPASSSVVWP